MARNAHLVMARGPRPGETFALDESPLVLGRDPRNAIVIDHPQVSRRHARITSRGDTWVIEDMESTNGTFVNGTRLVGSHPLVTGDVIGLSETVLLTFQEGEPTSEAFPEGTVSPAPAPPAPPADREVAAQQTPPFEPRARRTGPPPPASLPPKGPETEPRPDRTLLWIGAGCAILLLIAVCAVVLILAYLDVLPAIF